MIPDKEREMVNEILKVLDAHGDKMNEVLVALINTVAFVILTGIVPEHREEALLLFMADMPKAINYLADQLGMGFDWEKFAQCKASYENDNQTSSMPLV